MGPGHSAHLDGWGERDVNISAQDQREHLERDTAQRLLDQLQERAQGG